MLFIECNNFLWLFLVPDTFLYNKLKSCSRGGIVKMKSFGLGYHVSSVSSETQMAYGVCMNELKVGIQEITI